MISISKLLNNKIQNEQQTELAVEIQKYLHNGKVIPSNLIIKLIEENIDTDKKGILIMGFPRTKEQIFELKKLMKTNGYELDSIWLPKIINIEKIISKTTESITQKSHKIDERNRLLIKEMNEPEKIIKLEYEYPVWENEIDIECKIKAVHNKKYS